MADCVMRTFFLFLIGISYGLLAAAGVFTVLVAVGLIPRFAGKTHTAKHILLYEEMVIFGTLTGCFISVFTRYCQFGAWWRQHFPGQMQTLQGIGVLWQMVFGIFSGMFIGCLALAIAEMLDSIPILSRRISFRHGLGLAIISMAFGKLCGALIYFLTEFHRTVA